MWKHNKKEKDAPDRLELIDPNAFGSHQVPIRPAYPQPAATYNGTAPAGAQMGGPSSTDGDVQASDRSRFLRLGSKNFKGLARFGLPKGAFKLYIDDLYHTLLNMPRYRFLASFFAVYLTLYLFFSFFYVAISWECLCDDPDVVTRTFAHDFWFSVWTASTIGYSGNMRPSPDCPGVNILVTIQLIVSALIDTMLMSLVFSRFAAPMPRAKTIRYSTHAVLARPAGTRFWTISFRLANIRKHSLMEPEIVLLLAVPDQSKAGSAAFRFVPLQIDDLLTQTTSVKLGLPVTITHVITPSSPMYDLSLEAMAGSGMEVLCFMSGLDPMTSNMLQAHHTYRPSDVRMNEQFVAIHISTNKMGRMGVDLSVFDATDKADMGMGRDESHQVLYPVGLEAGSSREGMREHMEELRTRTIRSLTEPTLPHSTSVGQLEAYGSVGGGAGARGTGNGQGALWHPLVGTPGGMSPPALPVSWAPARISGNLGTQRSMPDALPECYSGGPQQPPSGPGDGGQQWDAEVRALCEAVRQDPGAAPAVRQQAAALRLALLAVPGGPLQPEPRASSMTAAGTGAGGSAPGDARAAGTRWGPPSFDMLS